MGASSGHLYMGPWFVWSCDGTDISIIAVAGYVARRMCHNARKWWYTGCISCIHGSRHLAVCVFMATVLFQSMHRWQGLQSCHHLQHTTLYPGQKSKANANKANIPIGISLLFRVFSSSFCSRHTTKAWHLAQIGEMENKVRAGYWTNDWVFLFMGYLSRSRTEEQNNHGLHRGYPQRKSEPAQLHEVEFLWFNTNYNVGNMSMFIFGRCVDSDATLGKERQTQTGTITGNISQTRAHDEINEKLPHWVINHQNPHGHKGWWPLQSYWYNTTILSTVEEKGREVTTIVPPWDVVPISQLTRLLSTIDEIK